MTELDRYRIAETEIGIRSPYDAHRSFCKDYISQSNETPELIIDITEEDIKKEFSNYKTYTPTPEGASLSLIFRKLSEYIIKKGGFMMHSAVIEYSGRAYAFTAPSGTGKSTHIKNWRKLLGDRINIVNGDKPIIICKNGVFYACGTPWAGKEGWQRNVCVPMGGICRIKRGSENRIQGLNSGDCAEIVLKSTLIPTDTELLMTLLDTVDAFATEVPSYELYCTADENSAAVSFEAMTGDNI